MIQELKSQNVIQSLKTNGYAACIGYTLRLKVEYKHIRKINP